MSNNSYSFNNNILEYSLVLGGSNFSYVDEKGSTVNSCPPIVSGSRAKVKYSGIDEDLYLSLYGVTFRRRMYDTGYIKAELLIQTKADLGVKDISGMLLRRSVTLKAGDKEVAKNYFIRDLSPQFEGGTDNTFSYIYIRLDIVSQDSLLKFNRYSQAHLGQKFITEIVKPAADVAGVGLRGVDDSTLQWLAYLDSSNKQVEYIQPYVVQYNESFYDFMKRVANRCGEPFYFEDGQLCFGLPKNGGTTNVAGARRIIFQRVSDGPYSCDPFLGTDYARDSLKEYRTYTKDNTPYWTYEPDDKHILTDKVEKENGYPADAFKSGTFIRNSEIASEDHYMLLFKDKFARDSSTDLWLGDLEARIVGWVSLVLNSTSLLEAVGKFAEKEIDAAFKLIAKANTATAAGNQALADAAVSSSNDYAVLFSKVDDNKKHWITLDYYKNIRDKGEEQARKMVCIDMGEHYCDIRLGDKITIPNDDGSTYVVIDIEMTSGVPWKRTYDGFTGDATPEGGAQSQRIYAIPLTSDGKFFPPVLTDKPFRVSGPQPAFIVDAGDFANQGRVRIRYP